MDIVGPMHRSKQKRFLLVLTGFFLKMGLSRLLRKHQRHPSRKFRVEKHRLQIWCPIRNRNGQRIPFYFDQIRGLMRKMEDTTDQIDS